MPNDLFFPQQVSGSSGSLNNSDYVNESFRDYVLPATNNNGLSSTISTNPLGDYFGNDLGAQYSIKTLYVKDLVLEEDRSKWVNGGVTYRVIFNENFPGVHGYITGPASIIKEINGTAVSLNRNVSLFGVSGKIVKAFFLVKPRTSMNGNAAPSVSYTIDSGAATTVALTPFSDENGGANTAENHIYDQHKYYLVDDGGANQTDDIHDYRIKVRQSNDDDFLEVIGVVVYLSTSSTHVTVKRGDVFVDKALSSSNVGSSLAISAQNASLFHLGAKTTFYQNTAGAVGSTIYTVPLLQTQATGLSGTNTVAVSAGSGASYPVGTGFNIQAGTSNYLGIVQSVSTDTLTVSPTLPYGVSGATMTKAFFSPQPVTQDMRLNSISAAIYDLAYSWDPRTTYGASNWVGRQFFRQPTAGSGFTNNFAFCNSYYDPNNNFMVMPIVEGTSFQQGRMFINEGKEIGWVGPLAVKGDFQAVEFEFMMGTSLLSTTKSTIDGITCFAAGLSLSPLNSNTAATMPRYFKLPFVQDLGIGYHTFNYIPSSFDSTGLAGGGDAAITKINFYKYKGVSISGQVYSLEQNQSQFNLPTAKYTPIGAYKFFGSDKLAYAGEWYKTLNGVTLLSTFPAFAQCVSGATSNAVCTFKYFGKDFTLFTDSAGGSYTTTLDGGAITPVSGSLFSVATEMIHTLVISRASGTFAIQGIAIMKDFNELKFINNESPIDTSVHGRNVVDRSLPITKVPQRFIGTSCGIGGFAVGPSIIDFKSGFTTTVALIPGAELYLETTGNPVFLGLNSAYATYVSGATLSSISVNGGATVGNFLNLYFTRTPLGQTLMSVVPTDDTDPFGKVANFTFGNKIGTTAGFINTHNFVYSPDSAKVVDICPPGRWVYRAYCLPSGAGTTSIITNCRMFAMEMF